MQARGWFSVNLGLAEDKVMVMPLHHVSTLGPHTSGACPQNAVRKGCPVPQQRACHSIVDHFGHAASSLTMMLRPAAAGLFMQCSPATSSLPTAVVLTSSLPITRCYLQQRLRLYYYYWVPTCSRGSKLLLARMAPLVAVAVRCRAADCSAEQSCTQQVSIVGYWPMEGKIIAGTPSTRTGYPRSAGISMVLPEDATPRLRVL